MKNVILLIALSLFAGNASAVTGKDSWKVIRESRDVLIKQPEFARVFGSQGLFSTCVTDTEIRSINGDASIPRSEIPRTSFELVVIEAQGEEYGTFIFSKTFAVPNCD